MYFDQYNNYFEDEKNNTQINIDNIYFNRNSPLTTVEDGFNKGNMFNNIYTKYKNHVYKLKTINQKDNLLYKLQMKAFALKDLNLYLDTHPTDQSILVEYKKIKTSYEKIKDEYEKKYGVLFSIDVDNDDKWNWIDNPWPWDKGVK